MATTELQRALDVVEALPAEDQEVLVDLVRRRLAERRRTEVSRNAEATQQAVREGRARIGALEDLKAELLPTHIT